MLRRDRWTLFGLVSHIAIAVACGSDSEPSPPLGGAPGPTSSAPGGTEPALNGEVVPGETPNAGLDGAPVVGDNEAESAGAGGAMGAGSGGPASVGGAAGAAPSGSPFPDDVTRARIMIVGDSISAGAGCYKKYLLADLNANGYTNFDFVGEYTDDCGGGVMHSARSCSTAQQYTQPSFTLDATCNPSGTFPGMSPLVAEHRPDLVMIQLGVNDVWGSRSPDAVLADYTTLLEQSRALNPDMVFAVAQIHKIRPTGADGEAVFARAQQLIEAVPAWAAAQTLPDSPVFVADLWTNSDPADAADGVHPDDAGALRMGQNWFEALRGILPAD